MPTYTSLETSKKLHDLGIEVESEKWHNPYNRTDGGYDLTNGNAKAFELAEKIPRYNKYPKAYRAYSLSDLPEVLKAVGEKLGWNGYKDTCNYKYLECGECKNDFRNPFRLEKPSDNKEYNYKNCESCQNGLTDWQSHFLEIARIYTTNPTEAFKYLDTLLENK